MRTDGRDFSQLRPIRITPHVSEFAEGSAMVEFGKTKVLCTASYEPMPPKWLQGTGTGWITAEYGMLPRSTQQRLKRDKTLTGGRTQEISRLIGRSLRAAIDPKILGERQITIDCDVLQADGGTRTAAITGGFVALALALKKLQDVSEIKSLPLINYVAAISIGLEKGRLLLDLNYDEDSMIGTDMNFVMTQKNEFIEVQGTAEHVPFNKGQLMEMMDLAQKGCQELFRHQAEIIGNFFPLK
ncbi:MAG: ribonuclease PH [Pseudobdellovibrionaceae bacterium]